MIYVQQEDAEYRGPFRTMLRVVTRGAVREHSRSTSGEGAAQPMRGALEPNADWACGDERVQLKVCKIQRAHCTQRPSRANAKASRPSREHACTRLRVIHAMQGIKAQVVKYSQTPVFSSIWQNLARTGFRAGNMVRTRSKIMTSSKTSRRRF